MIIANSYPPVTEPDLVVCEQELGRTIPEPYRSFLLRHNGGTPEPNTFEWTTERGRRVGAGVGAFFAVHDADGASDTLAYCAETWLRRDRVPADLFPIARERGGNLVLLGAGGERKGKVFYWDHNWEAGDDEPPTYRNVHDLADSFEAFLAMLHD